MTAVVMIVGLAAAWTLLVRWELRRQAIRRWHASPEYVAFRRAVVNAQVQLGERFTPPLLQMMVTMRRTVAAMEQLRAAMLSEERP